MRSLARRERAALCDLFEAVGPDVATLCAGWQTVDLAAHLVVRERTLLAAGGIAISALAGRTCGAMAHYAARPTPSRSTWSVPGHLDAGVPGIDAALNGTEFCTHHEDVRRAAEDWQPRALPGYEQASCGGRWR